MNIILLALPSKSLGFHCLFHFHSYQFGSVFTKNTYYYYLIGTVLNPAHILMISCTSYSSSYNPLFINILVSRRVIPSLLSTDPSLEAPPGGQQQKLPFPLISSPLGENRTPELSGFAHSSTNSLLELSFSFEQSRIPPCYDLPRRAESLIY